MTQGERIRKRRLELGLTMQELAERVGAAKATISNWETDERGMSLYYAEKLADALETSIYYFLGRENPPMNGKE